MQLPIWLDPDVIREIYVMSKFKVKIKYLYALLIYYARNQTRIGSLARPVHFH
jgi:hypothetical protein